MSGEQVSSRLELQKRIQERLKQSTVTSTRPTPATFQQLPSFLRQVLPDNYTYIIKSYKELDVEPTPGAPEVAFDSTFYVNISNAEAIEEWRTEFHNKTGTVFRITRADKVKGIKVIYHKDFHCRHADIAAIKYMQKTYAQKVGQRRSRNTNCQCLAKIRLEKSRLQLSHPCEIHLVYNHNHPLDTFPATNAQPLKQLQHDPTSSHEFSNEQLQSLLQPQYSPSLVKSSPQLNPATPLTESISDISEPLSLSNHSSPHYISDLDYQQQIENNPPINSSIMPSTSSISPPLSNLQANHIQQMYPRRRQASISSASSISTHTSVALNPCDAVLSDFRQFAKETENDIVSGDMQFCGGLTKFMESHRKARRISLAHATDFLNQLHWSGYDAATANEMFALDAANATATILDNGNNQYQHLHEQQQIVNINGYQMHLLDSPYQQQSYEQQVHHAAASPITRKRKINQIDLQPCKKENLPTPKRQATPSIMGIVDHHEQEKFDFLSQI